MVIKKILQFILLVTFSMNLTSCAVYSSKFNCPEGVGLSCEMLGDIDKKIDSGEIEKIYRKKCKGNKCNNNEVEDIIKPKTDQIKAKLTDSSLDGDDIIIEADNRNN